LRLELYWQGVIAGSVIVIEVLMAVFGMADTQPISPGPGLFTPASSVSFRPFRDRH
jgi:hypothetical protein